MKGRRESGACATVVVGIKVRGKGSAQKTKGRKEKLQVCLPRQQLHIRIRPESGKEIEINETNYNIHRFRNFGSRSLFLRLF